MFFTLQELTQFYTVQDQNDELHISNKSLLFGKLWCKKSVLSNFIFHGKNGFKRPSQAEQSNVLF